MALWIQSFLQINKFSRPGTKLLGVRGIVMHWTADPGATDENEVNYFDGADGGGGRYASAHIFVDRDSARLDIPLNEVAYHANEKPCKIPRLQASIPGYVGGANLTAIGVEMCIEKDGTIHPDTISRTADVVGALCKQFKLNPVTDIYRHYDITGKNCPAPWVSSPQAFVDFKNKVNQLVKGEDDMLKVAVVINGLPDLGAAEPLADKVQGPILFKRDYAKGQKVAETVYIVGGANDPSLGNKVVFLGGADRYEVSSAVKKFLG
jgi:N-acetylmuramoyl-L-alanine amidase